ncbi:MAG: hypothetical protein ACP5VQ_00045 [Phycisphaerae bacterium]
MHPHVPQAFRLLARAKLDNGAGTVLFSVPGTDGSDLLCTSRAYDPGHGIPEHQIQKLRLALERLRKIAASSEVEPDLRDMADCFLLLDPAKLPEMYRLYNDRPWYYGPFRRRRLAVLWGLTKDGSDNVQPMAAVEALTPHERRINMNINAVLKFLWKDSCRRLCVGLVLGLLLVCFPRLFYIPVADSSCQQYFKSSLLGAGASYLLCRSVIGGLDTFEHSQIGIGVGVDVDVEPARITDPLRDVAERASDVLFTAILTLTVEEIGYEIMRTLGVQVIGVVLLLISLAALFPRWSQRPINLGIRVLVLLVALRLALPASAGLCTVVNAEIFAPKIAAARESVAQAFPTKAANALSDWSLPKVSSGSWYSEVPRVIEVFGTYAFDKITAFYKALGAITLHMKPMAEGLTVLSGLFVAQIIFQAVPLPLAVYWILVKICGLLFNWNLPPVLKPESSRIGGTSTTGQ